MEDNLCDIRPHRLDTKLQRTTEQQGESLDQHAIEYWETDRIGRGMRQWRREVPQIDSSGKAVVGRVLHLQQIIIDKVNRNLARFSLKFPSYAILATIRVSGPPYRMTPSELLSAIVISSGGLSNLLRKLEQDGMVRRSADERDGRGVLVQLTEEGIALAEVAMTAHAALEMELVAAISPLDREEMARLLSVLIATNSAG